MRAVSFALAAATLVSVPSFATATPIQPGEWEVRSQVTAANMPGMPPQAMKAMKKPQIMRHCITPEQAAKGPRELLDQSKGECRFTRYNLSGGRIDAAMQCNSRQRGAMTATTKGSFTPIAYNTTSTVVMTGPQGKMTMTTAGQGRRIGACRK